jgi:cobalt-zinc-cadmium efflux system membrane fusion protein
MGLALMLGLLLGAGAMAGAVFIVLPALQPMSPPQPQPTPVSPPPAGTPPVVTLLAQQSQNITIAPVGERRFRNERLAVGKIGFNEELVTPVFSPYTGRVMRVLAKRGDVIHPGTPLLELYTPDFVQAETDLISAVAALTKAQHTLQLATRNEARQHRLYDNGAGPLKDWEQAQADLAGAQNDVYAAEAVLHAVRGRLRTFGKTDAEITRIEQTRQVERVTTITSPIAGTITGRKVSPGQFIRPDNADPLFTVADLSSMWMLAQVYEADIASIKVGQPVEVQVLAYPKEVFKATIVYIGPTVDPSTRRVEVRAVVDNAAQKLKPEMFATFRIQTGADVTAPAVPVSAIVQDGPKKSLWVVQQGQEAVRREVQTGLEQDGYVQILAGVQAGERIVTDGSLFVGKAGQS